MGVFQKVFFRSLDNVKFKYIVLEKKINKLIVIILLIKTLIEIPKACLDCNNDR